MSFVDRATPLIQLNVSGKFGDRINGVPLYWLILLTQYWIETHVFIYSFVDHEVHSREPPGPH